MIKGFQLKAVKNFRGHEGEPLQQGNLYLGNKKIGYVSENAYGGSANIDVDREYREEWEQASKLYEEEHPEARLESPEITLFYALLENTQNEKVYKSAVKKGFSITAHFEELMKLSDGTMCGNGRQIILSASNMEQVEEYEENDWKSKGKKYEKSVFTSLEDFIIA